MEKFLAFACLILATFALSTRGNSHLQLQSHFLDGQLCTKVGGKVCGFIKKDCCSDGCDSPFFGFNEKCLNGKQLDLSTIPSCNDFCTSNKGVVFKNDILGDEQCCKKQDLKDNKCPTASLIDLKKCTKGTLASKIAGYVSPSMKM